MRIFLMTLAALSLHLPLDAEAQRPSCPMPSPHASPGTSLPVRPALASNLLGEAQRMQGAALSVRSLAQQEAASPEMLRLTDGLSARTQAITQEIRRYGAANPRTVRQLRHAYLRTRRALVSDAFHPSNRLLDRWDDIVSTWRRIQRDMVISTQASTTPTFDRSLRANVSLNQRTFDFQGRQADHLFQSCQRTLRQAGMYRIRHVDLHTQEYAPLMSQRRAGLSPTQACSLVVLNAYPSRPNPRLPTYAGRASGYRFNIQAPAPEVMRRLRAYLPRLLGPGHVGSLSLQGQSLLHGASVPLQTALNLLAQRLDGMNTPMMHTLQARGRVENAPFAFQGTRAAMQSQCSRFLGRQIHGPIRRVEVHGQRYSHPNGFWNAGETCNLILGAARPLQSLPGTVQVHARTL